MKSNDSSFARARSSSACVARQPPAGGGNNSSIFSHSPMRRAGSLRSARRKIVESPRSVRIEILTVFLPFSNHTGITVRSFTARFSRHHSSPLYSYARTLFTSSLHGSALSNHSSASPDTGHSNSVLHSTVAFRAGSTRSRKSTDASSASSSGLFQMKYLTCFPPSSLIVDQLSFWTHSRDVWSQNAFSPPGERNDHACGIPAGSCAASVCSHVSAFATSGISGLTAGGCAEI